MLKPLAAALIAATSLTAIAAIAASPAAAETVLRLDEVAVGELDPAKATDYADSILMFNVYDTLVLSKQGGAGVVPHLAESWETDGKTYTFKLRTDVKFQSGNPLTADDVVFSLDRMKKIGQGLSYLFANVEKAEAVDAGPSSSRCPARTRRSSRRCCACRSSTRSWSWKISPTAKAT